MALPDVVLIGAHDYASGAFTSVEAPVVPEYSVTLSIDGHPFVSISCTGTDLELLALGHLMAEGIVESLEEIESVEVDEDNLTIDVKTGLGEEMLERIFRVHRISFGAAKLRAKPKAGVAKKLETAPPVLKAQMICACVAEFLRTSDLHRTTGGVHSAALYSVDGERMVFFDEIGRHNAVDKLIGYAVRQSLDLGSAMLLSTGRLSREILSKVLAVGAPVVVSKASPTSLAVEMARESGIVMIGNVRARRLRVYSGIEYLRE